MQIFNKFFSHLTAWRRCRTVVVPLSYRCRTVVVPLSYHCRIIVVSLSYHCRNVVIKAFLYFGFLEREKNKKGRGKIAASPTPTENKT